MKTQLFAIFDKRGFVRATKKAVDLCKREIGVVIDVDVPDSIFDDGYIHASIAVPEGAFTLPDIVVAVSVPDKGDGADALEDTE